MNVPKIPRTGGYRMPSYNYPRRISRRSALQTGLGALAAASVGPALLARAHADPHELIMGTIPRSGERIPMVGLGTWQTFMLDSPEERAPVVEVMRRFVALGGTVLDSSPMYTGAEDLTGEIAEELGIVDDLWMATKVWIDGEAEGRAQMAQSFDELRRDRMELMQVHNLRDVDIHLATLEEMKADGRIRYIGITTSTERQYDEVEALLDDERIDFLQVNYSLMEQEAAERVLPKALDKGVAVMLNRPFGGGGLFGRFANQPLPDWAAEIDCSTWSQIFLKYILSHPAVTCAIPATGNPDHLTDNMGAGRGRLPDEEMRQRIVALLD